MIEKMNFWWKCIYLQYHNHLPLCMNPNLYMTKRRRDCLMGDCDCMVFEGEHKSIMR